MSRYPMASHIRGRLESYRTPYGLRWYGVVENSDTGRVIASDNGWASLERAATDVAVMVEAARGAWFFGIRQKDVTRGC